MKKRVLHNKWIRGLLIFILLIVVLGVGINLGFTGILKKNHISYSYLDYQFPATLLVSDFSIQRGDSILVEIATLEVDWTWRSLLRKQPEITRLVIDDADITVSSSGNKKTTRQQRAFPNFGLQDVQLTNIFFNAALNKDTLQVLLPELRLSAAGFDEQLFLDSLLLYQADINVHPDTTKLEQHSVGKKSFSLDKIPLAQVNHISLTESSISLRNPAMDHKISDINLMFSGWKKSEMVNFSLDRLGLTYQDTLDLQFVLENGNVNDQLQTRLQNINFITQGLNIQIDETILDLREQFNAAISLQSSYLTAGVLRKWVPAAAGMLHPDLPASTKIFIEGNLRADTGKIAPQSIRVSLLDSTSFTLSGDIFYTPSLALEVMIDPLITSRSNLKSFLAPQDYHELFHWPVDIRGWAGIQGSLSRLRIDGTLESRQGQLSIAANFQTGTAGQSKLSLKLSGDSLMVDQFTPLLPFEVPLGQLSFRLQQQTKPDRLSIIVKSEWLNVLDRKMDHIALTYESNTIYENIQASINDEEVKLDFQLHTPTEQKKKKQIENRSDFLLHLHHFQPNAFKPSLPEGTISGTFEGNMSRSGKNLKAGINVRSAVLATNTESINVPDSEIDLFNSDSVVELTIFSNNSRVLYAHTGKNFPPFTMPPDQWIAAWPETELEMNIALGEQIIELLTGTPGRLKLDHARIEKDSLNFHASVSIPEALFGDYSIADLTLEIESAPGNIFGQVGFGSLSNSTSSIDSFTVDVGYSGDEYSLAVGFNGNDTVSQNYISMLLNRQPYGFNLRFNNTEPLILSNHRYDLLENDGMMFNKQMKLLGGNLGIGSGNMKLDLSSADEYVNINVDSFEVFTMLKPFELAEIESILINGLGEFNIRTKDASVYAEVFTRHLQLEKPLQLKVDGLKKGQLISGTLQVQHPDLVAGIDLMKNEEIIAYSTDVSMVNTELFHLFPGWPQEVEMTGKIRGSLKGTLQPEFSNDGYIIADQLSVKQSMIPSSFYIPEDTIILINKKFVFSDFQFTDSRGSQLTLNGDVAYAPEPVFDIDLSSDGFTLIHSNDRNARLRGDLNALFDLDISGDLNNLAVTGALETLPGGNIIYRNEKRFTLVDASDIVTFMDLDASEKETIPPGSGNQTAIDLDVSLALNNTYLEVLLDEISGEFIELYGSGDLRLRTGPGNTPQVFGTIRSSTGRAYIQPDPMPELDVVINQAEATWTGPVDDPLISFRGYKTVKAPASGLSLGFSERTDMIDYKIEVILDKVTLSKFDLQFDLSANDAAAGAYLSSLSKEKRQVYAINLLVFGRIGAERLPANSLVANQVTQKLNELARRNLKNTGVRFSSETYRETTDGISARERTDLNYAISRRFLDNRLSFEIGGSMGLYSDDITELPPADLIGDLEVNYKLSDQPSLILKGKRKNIYEGILDGMVTEESLGIYFQKSYPTVKEMFNQRKKETSSE